MAELSYLRRACIIDSTCRIMNVPVVCTMPSGRGHWKGPTKESSSFKHQISNQQVSVAMGAGPGSPVRSFLQTNSQPRSTSHNAICSSLGVRDAIQAFMRPSLARELQGLWEGVRQRRLTLRAKKRPHASGSESAQKLRYSTKRAAHSMTGATALPRAESDIGHSKGPSKMSRLPHTQTSNQQCPVSNGSLRDSTMSSPRQANWHRMSVSDGRRDRVFSGKRLIQSPIHRAYERSVLERLTESKTRLRKPRAELV